MRATSGDFFDMRQELVAAQVADPLFEPALPLVDNPEAQAITNEFTADVFAAADEAYVTLLYMMTGLYARFVPTGNYSHLSTALARWPSPPP